MLLSLLLAATVAPGTRAPDPRHTLMPVPTTFTWGEGAFRVDSTFAVAVKGPSGDGRLARGVERFRLRLEQRTGLLLRRGGAGLVLEVASPGQAVQGLDENESYRLDITAGGAVLRAATTVGALRGLETVLQLLDSDATGWLLPAVHIEDTPRFPWRGLMIDVARHWEPADVIKRQLDGMAAVKLNVFHWHLSDDQGFRVESRRYPRLHQMGSDGNYYTQAEIREVVAYARDRGIRVVPEFDMPGHSTAWFAGYPEHASAPGPYRIERRFGVFAPTFDPTREATYTFLDGFIGEMTALFPDRYWHIGGDEVEGAQWKNNPRIRAFMRTQRLANNAALQAHFNRRMTRILTARHRLMVGWDEILHDDLPRTTVVQSWRGQEWLGKGAKAGVSGVLSAGWYLDHMRTAEFHYLVDPLPEGTPLTPAEQARVLGGEACMWGEHLTPESIDSRIWPRLAAIAERLWSPPEVRDVPDMYRRLDVMRGRLEALGLGHEGHTPRLARNLADGHDAAALIDFLGLMEPIRFGERVSRQKLTQQVPLVFVADAARPDPPAQWESRRWANGVVARDPASRAALEAALVAWGGFGPRLAALAALTPLVKDALPAAEALARVAAIGREALAQLDRGKADSAWVRPRLAALDSLYRPQGLLRVTVVPAVRRLVEAAGNGGK